jgi:hypothetical protein
LVLASLAASSLYGIFLHVALTVCIYWLDVFQFPELKSNLVFLDKSKISDSDISDKCSPVVYPFKLDLDMHFK